MQQSLESDRHTQDPIVLSVSPRQADHRAVKELLTSWTGSIFEAASFRSARQVLAKQHIGVVLCERVLGSRTWIDVLNLLFRLPNPPPLIVTSRLADDFLWAEALNRGAYDVLAKPFDRQELLRTVNLAWLRWFHARDTGLRTLRVRTASGA